MGGNEVWSPDLWAPDAGDVLGQRFDVHHQQVYRDFQEAYCKADGIPEYITSTRRVMDIPEHGCDDSLDDLRSIFLDNFALELDRAVLGRNGTRRVRSLELLTTLMPSDIRSCRLLEPYTVPDDDPRHGLRGELGVHVKRDARRGLAAGDFVALYRGHSMLGHLQFESFKADQCEAVAAAAAAADQQAAFWRHELKLESYAATTVDMPILEFTQKYGIKIPHALSISPQDILLISAHGVGNIGCLINDPELDPLGSSEAVSPLKANVCMCEIHIGAWPWLVMFASRDIRPGEELRYAYGKSFWSNLKGKATMLKRVLGLGRGAGGGAQLAGGGGGGADSQPLLLPETEAAVPMEGEGAAESPGTTELQISETEAIDNGISEEDSEEDDEGLSPALPLRASQESGAAGPALGSPALGTVSGASPSHGRRRIVLRKTPRGAMQQAKAKPVAEATRAAEVMPPQIGVEFHDSDDEESYETARESTEEEAAPQRHRPGARPSVAVANAVNAAASAAATSHPGTAQDQIRLENALSRSAAAAAAPDTHQAVAAAVARLRRAERDASMFKHKLERCEEAVAELEEQVQEAQSPPALPLLDDVPPVPAGQQPTSWRRAQIFCIFVGDVMKGPYDTGHLGELSDGGLSPTTEVFLDPTASQRAPEASAVAQRVLGPGQGGTWSLEEVLSMAFMESPQVTGSPSSQQPQPTAQLLKELATAQEELEKARQVYARKEGEVEKGRAALAEAEVRLPPGERSVEAEQERARQKALGKRPAVESPVKPPAKIMKVDPDGAGTSAAHAAMGEAAAAAAAAAAARQPRSSDDIEEDVVDLTFLDD